MFEMADEGFEDWDADFLEKVIQVEELAIAATQSKPPPPPPPVQPPQQRPLPSQQPIRLGYAHEASNTCYSPPRELLQRTITSKGTEYDNRSSVSQPTNGVAAVAPVVRSSRSARGGGSGSDSEISKLKKELERVTKLLSKRVGIEALNLAEHECLELQLRKEREKKEVQLQSATFPKEARSSKAYGLRNSNLDLTDPSQDCAGVSACCLKQNASNEQERLQSGRGSSSYHAKGVQTEVEIDDMPVPPDRETASCNSLLKKLKAIRHSSTDLYSGRYLVSKLLVVCATELQVLFGYSKSTTSSKAKEAVNDGNPSHVISVVDDKLTCSDAAKVTRFYIAVTKMSNGMVQFESFFQDLLELCYIQDAVILLSSVSILHVVLLHFAGYQGTSTRYLTVISIYSLYLDYCASEAITDDSAFYGTESIKNRYHKHYGADYLHVTDTAPSCIEWFSLFQLMHQISHSATDEPILYEAVSVMNVILKRYGPSQRERYGQITVFQTVPKLLKKEAGLRVQKEAVHLLYLLVNCPTVLASLYSGFKENMPSSNSENDAPAFKGLSSLFAGLEDCLMCGGTVLQALEVQRNAIILVSYLVFFGTSYFDVLWSSTTCNKTGFLVLILRVLSSEMDPEVFNPCELTDILKERTLLARESLIFLNRIVSHPNFSSPALQALTSTRDVASLIVETTSRLSRKGKSTWQDDVTTKQMLENEIPDLARRLYRRVCAFLGDNVSL
ncbi:unnamed protein product [Rhodiola kirilowii]